jgi:hypothetical protein
MRKLLFNKKWKEDVHLVAWDLQTISKISIKNLLN